MKFFEKMLFTSIVTGLFGLNTAFALTLDDYSNPNAACFDRQKNSYLTVADTHVHIRPFSGPAVPYREMVEEMKKNGVLFAGVLGIGQRLPYDAPKHCHSYRDCPGVKATPSIVNDMVDAAQFSEYRPEGIKMVHHMTFADLADPESVAPIIKLYDKEFPGLFKMMGEVNVVKQALFPNKHEPVTKEQIDKWPSFMKVLRERNMPLSLHSDLGRDSDNPADQTKYLPLIEHVLARYPQNKIVWLHMGISGEQKKLPVATHIKVMTDLMKKYPNLYMDISWGVLEENYFSKHRTDYVAFINQFSDRMTSGSDYVAYAEKRPGFNYTNELKVSSEINKYLDDKAFRNIALGQTYLTMLGMTKQYNAPKICSKNK